MPDYRVACATYNGKLVSGQARLGRVEMVGEATGLKQGCQPVGFVVLAREDTQNPRRCDSCARI